MVPVPHGWSEVTPSWLTSALAARVPGAVVGSVEVRDLAHGTNSRARVALGYERGDGPESVFVKLPGKALHRLALLALRAVGTEARLAASGADLPIERPLPYAGGVDARRIAAAVVMEDVTAAGGRTNDATTALTVAEARSGLDGLARLHAAFWDRRLAPQLAFLRPWRLGRAWTTVSTASLRRGLRRFADYQGERGEQRVAIGLRARDLAHQFRQSALLAASGEQTVLHGDPHPGNTYLLTGRTGFLDWQLARTGHWSHDAGYFIGASLDVADRRAYERELLSGYIETLGRAGVRRPPSPDEAWDRYRATPAFGLATWLHTLAFGSLQPADVCLATIRRFAAAYEDLDTGRSAVAGGG